MNDVKLALLIAEKNQKSVIISLFFNYVAFLQHIKLFVNKKYQKYSDFTIRYRRDMNPHQDRHQSEYYKMKADYFTYGITNCYKTDFTECSDFVKYAIIDLEKVYTKIDSDEIRIEDNHRMTCQIIDDKIVCPIKYNRDDSSSFFPIEIYYLVKMWGSEIIISQKGFF